MNVLTPVVLTALAAAASSATAQCTPSPTNFCVTETGVYRINGTPQAPITLTRGQTYTFQMVNVSNSHPFYITTNPRGGGSGMYTTGVSPTSVTGNAVMTFIVPMSAPNQLYYGCTQHQDMGGPITIINPPACYANCDGSTTQPILNVDDFTCFINEFAAAQSLSHQQQIPHYANCDNSTTAPVLNVDDFTCFINAFAAGCP